jgi:hypothetical protein
MVWGDRNVELNMQTGWEEGTKLTFQQKGELLHALHCCLGLSGMLCFNEHVERACGADCKPCEKGGHQADVASER